MTKSSYAPRHLATKPNIFKRIEMLVIRYVEWCEPYYEDPLICRIWRKIAK